MTAQLATFTAGSPARSSPRVQRRAQAGRTPGTARSHPARAGRDGYAAIHAAAARGTATPWSAPPHAGAIQRPSGRHEVSSVQAHAGGAALTAAADPGSSSAIHADPSYAARPMWNWRTGNNEDAGAGHTGESARSPGQQALTEARAPVQREQNAASTLVGGEVQRHAARGVRGPGEALPHRATIETLFGRDLSHVRAHVGGAAAESAQAIGAEAYATGNRVAFRKPPSLHTAAHEAAHVVQQAAGVQLLGGVGHAGDEYERNADAVADRVVSGASAADLLPGGRDAAGTAAVQPKRSAEPVQAQPVQRDETPAPSPYVTDGKPNLAAVQNPMNHPEWPTFRDAMARYDISEALAGEQWQKLCRGLELQATGGNGEALFREVTDWMVQTSGIDKYQKPALWAGYPTGALAQKCGFNPLADAALGNALAPLQLFDGDFQTTMRPLWVAISRAFADQLQGDVHVFMAKYAAESIVLTDELPILRQRQLDGIVGDIIYYAIDPASMPNGDTSHPIFLDAAGQPAEHLHPLHSELEVQSALQARAAANAAGAK